jgi:amino-acid N-acetyltransferase
MPQASVPRVGAWPAQPALDQPTGTDATRTGSTGTDAIRTESTGTDATRTVPSDADAFAETVTTPDGTVVRRARIDDIPGIATVMARYVEQNVLLPRPVSELYQCVREFHVAERDGRIVACAALRLLWRDLGEVRSLAVQPDAHGQGLGQVLVAQVVADARALGLPRVIALTREVQFFERCGFRVEPRDAVPRKVWTDCVRCPRRHACDEIAVALDLVPGASAAAARDVRAYTLPAPPPASHDASLPVIQ